MRILAVLAALVALHAPALAGPQKIALFPIELYDTSLEGEVEGVNPDEQARLVMIDQELHERLAASGKFEPIDTAAAAQQIEDAGYLRSCNGCEVRIAKTLGADLALVGWVQKVSNLILNINLTIREVATGELVFANGVDIRGNTDQTWRHGISYLVRNRLLKD